MLKARVIGILLAVAVVMGASWHAEARVRTTQRNLSTNSVPVDRIEPTGGLADEESADVDQSAVSLRGYTKRASDSRETFLITNHTSGRMSHVRLRFRYSTLGGEVLHERVVPVEVNLKAGETRLVSVPSWDKQRMFYFHGGSQPRKPATPYRIAYALVGYDIPVGK